MNRLFPFASSTDPDSAVAARDVARALKAGMVGPPAPIGLLYVASAFASEIETIVHTLQATTGVEAWTGAAGMGVIAGDQEIFEAPAVAAMALELDRDAVQPFGPVDSAAGFAAACAQAAAFSGQDGAALGLIHIDPTGDPTGRGVANLPAEFAEAGELYLTGGLCSGRDDMPAIGGGGAAAGAMTGALISLGSGVATGVSQGCAPIGPVRVIETAGVGVLQKLGDLSALAALYQDLGLPDDARADRLRSALGGVHIAIPVEGADRRDYVVRNITGIDVGQGLVGVAEAVEDGGRAFFCRRDAGSAVQDLKEMSAAAAKRLGKPARGAVYVSCLARGPNLFGPNSEEIAIVREAIGRETPVLGFFANGEIAHDRLYGYTGVLTLFG